MRSTRPGVDCTVLKDWERKGQAGVTDKSLKVVMMLAGVSEITSCGSL